MTKVSHIALQLNTLWNKERIKVLNNVYIFVYLLFTHYSRGKTSNSTILGLVSPAAESTISNIHINVENNTIVSDQPVFNYNV